jgi:hypothetical protein
MNGLIDSLMTVGERRIIEGESSARKKYVDTDKISKEDFDIISRGDPTPNKKYLDWMARTYAANPERPEHMGDVVRAWHRFVMRGKIEKKDIFQYRNVEELEQAVEKAESETEKKAVDKSIQKDAVKRFENERFVVIEPLSLEGSKPWGQEGHLAPGKAKWCITADWGWKSYYRQGDRFYFVYDKLKKKKWCIQVSPSGKKTAWDSEDRSMPYEQWLKKLGIEGGM